MTAFLSAIALFLAAHVVPAATGLRGYLIARFGRRAYVAAYSLVSLAAIAWVIVAALDAPYIELWPPGPVLAAVPLVAMLPASILMVAGAGQPNPLSVSFRGGLPDPRRVGLATLLRHPILWAFFLWAASHLVANGDAVSAILFGSLALFSLAGMRRLERRARQRLPEADYAAAVAMTSGGIAARLRRSASWRSAVQIGAGLVVYLLLLYLHEPVIGVAPLAWLA